MEVFNRFIIISDARTGGTHTVSTLNNHPNVKCVSEPFPHLSLETEEQQINWMKEFSDPENNLEKNIRAAGFRTKVEQIADKEMFKEFIKNENVLVFHLQRKNVVKKAISRIRAVALYKETKDYNVRSGNKPLPPINIPIDRLLKEVHQLEDLVNQERKFIESLDVKYYNLFYQNIIDNSDEYFRSIFAVLQVPKDHIPKSNVAKNTSNDLSKIVSNYHKLWQQLEGSPYRRMLSEK